MHQSVGDDDGDRWSVHCTYKRFLRRVIFGHIERRRAEDFAAGHLVVHDGLGAVHLLRDVW